MNNQSIGVFDSGIGGLTVLKKLHEALPNEHYIYIGDNLHSPYGEKTVEQLKTYATKIVEYFEKQDVKMIVLACNTTSCTVLPYLKEKFPNIPMVGVIDATVSMVKASNPNKVAIMATKATIESRAYQTKIGENQSIGIACPKLVPLIENGASQQEIRAELHHLLDEVTKNCDGIVLGCTHYPIISSEIASLYPNQKLFSSSEAVVKEVANLLREKDMASSRCHSKSVVYTTGDLDVFSKSSQTFFDSKDFILKKLILKVA